MKLLVVGGGGREHAIIRKLKENPAVETVFACPGNGGIGCDAVCTGIKATDIQGVLDCAKQNQVDFVVVAPDDPLVLGMVDPLEAAGFACFGPTKAAARLEGSKAFSKALMEKYNIPTAAYRVFDDPAAAIAYIDQGSFPVVIKADGLALGKGVLICQNREEAQAGVTDMLVDNKFGASGSRVVVEEFLTGPEVSVLAFTDGKAMVPMVSSMDHKRALDGDRGLNTGGMGTIAPNPLYTPALAAQCMEEIFIPTMEAMNAEGCTFKGCLFFGLILTPQGPKVIEYNCRFGDPETQVVLPLLETDLLTIMQTVSAGTLTGLDIKFSSRHAACIALASGGYPETYQTGLPISGLGADGQLPGGGATVYHAGTKAQAGGFVTAGGRVLGITALGDSLEAAIENAYAAADTITFPGLHRRSDIGQQALRKD